MEMKEDEDKELARMCQGYDEDSGLFGEEAAIFLREEEREGEKRSLESRVKS